MASTEGHRERDERQEKRQVFFNKKKSYLLLSYWVIDNPYCYQQQHLITADNNITVVLISPQGGNYRI